MNKIKTIAAAISCMGMLLVSTGVNAANSGNLGGAVTQANCTDGTTAIISADVTINTSKNVFGAYACRAADATATPPTVNRVGVGSCNTGGMSKSRSVTCTRLSNGDTPETFAYTPTKCTAANFDATSGVVKAGADGQVLVTGITMYTTSTVGGSIGSDGMAASACDASGIKSLVETKFP